MTSLPPAPDPEAPVRYFFVHMQKTGGTTVLKRLIHHFGEAAIYPDKSDGRPPETTIMVDHLLERWQVRGDEIRLVAGHFPLCTTDLLGVPFQTFTVLREPVERTLSYLRHYRKLTPGAEHQSLESLYEDPLRFVGLVHNHMTKMLSLRSEEMIAGTMTRVDFTPEHLDRAKEALVGVDVVGLQERFDDFCDELVARFGWDLGKAVRANTTEPIDIPAGLADRIAEDNALDVELYRFACDHVAERRRARLGSATG